MIPKYTTDCFSWCKETNTLVAEISTLPISRPQSAPPSFYLKSHKTGKVIRCQYVSTVRDDEGDILFWNYKPTEKDLAFNIEIFND